MNAHQTNYALKQYAATGDLQIPDPGDGKAFEIGDRFMAICHLNVIVGATSRYLPLALDSAGNPSLDIPEGVELLLVNTGTQSVSIIDMTDEAAFFTLAAGKSLLLKRIPIVSDGVVGQWAGVAMSIGAGA